MDGLVAILKEQGNAYEGRNKRFLLQEIFHGFAVNRVIHFVYNPSCSLDTITAFDVILP